MSEFEGKVQKGKVPQPTHKKFTLKKWKEAFESIQQVEERDLSLFKCGLWVFARLATIRSEVGKISFPLPRKKLLKLHIGYINRTYHTVRLKTDVKEMAKGDTFYVDELLQLKLKGNTLGIDLSPDTILTASIDGAVYPLASALALVSDEKGSVIKFDALQVINNEQKIMLLGQYYSYVEELWREILWNGYSIRRKEDKLMVVPQVSEFDRSRAVSDYRYQALVQQGLMTAVHLWRNGSISYAQKKELSIRPFIEIQGSGKSRRVKLTYDTSIENVPPYSLIAKITAQEEYLDDLMEEDFPHFDGLNLKLLLSAWEVMRACVKAIASRFPDNDGVSAIGTLYNYAPSISKSELRSLFVQHCEIDTDLADMIIVFFCFQPNQVGDLWSNPLVHIDDKLLPVISPIVSGNILRNIEMWLKRGGVDLAKRGALLEDQVRKELINAISESTLSAHSGCHPTAIRIGDNGEEVDLIFNLGHVVVVGEIKCSLYPTDAIEYYHIYNTLKYASEQARRKAEKVRDCFSEVKQKVETVRGFEAKDVTVIPLIITNTTVGVGFPVDSVPVVDMFILRKYFTGFWEKMVVFGPKGEKKAGETEVFYSNATEAVNGLWGYLCNPPQLAVYKENIDVEFMPHICFEEKELKAVSSRLVVKLPIEDLLKSRVVTSEEGMSVDKAE